MIGSGPAGKQARMVDQPGWAQDVRPGTGNLSYQFETAIFSIDSQQVLGVIKWGVTIPNDPNKAIILQKVEIEKQVSDDFKKAIQLANDVQGQKVKLGDQEVILNVVLHAQPNGDPKLTGKSVLPGK
ncbi:MAG: hypothetical protein K2R98_12470 [Gemmataceae bacterium]|nr:hypothetical protein [Gemmataceae bacterium]